jgi:hypothetical protein
MMTVHSGVRQGDDVETSIGTEMQESQPPETGGIHHRNWCQLTQEKHRTPSRFSYLCTAAFKAPLASPIAHGRAKRRERIYGPRDTVA